MSGYDKVRGDEFEKVIRGEDVNDMKLNIGCGFKKIAGFVNIDKAAEVGPDSIVDVENGLPFADNTFSCICSSHCLEHITPGRWRFVLNEISRVAKNGCLLKLELPYDNRSTRCHFDHYRTFNFSSFDQLCEDTARDYYFPFRFKRILPKPNKLYRIICNLFPLIKSSIKFEFEVCKPKG